MLVAGAVLLAAWSSERAGLPAARSRGRADVIVGAALVLALYALTATLRDQPATVSVILIGALALAIWAWWDPSPGSLLVAASAAVIGPVTEIVLVALGAASYADDSDALAGVAPWLPFLYFAAGAVAARLWPAISGDVPPRRD